MSTLTTYPDAFDYVGKTVGQACEEQPGYALAHAAKRLAQPALYTYPQP